MFLLPTLTEGSITASAILTSSGYIESSPTQTSFSWADKNWNVIDGTWNVVNNILYGSGSAEALITADNTAQTNYAVTMDTIINTGESSIVIRYVDANNYYWIGIGCWGHQYSIGKMLNGIPTELSGSGSASNIQQDITYTLKATANGNTLTLTVNGAQTLQTTDNAFSSGSFGIRTYNSSIQTISISITQASAPPSDFRVKSAHLNLNNIIPNHLSYVPNWLSLLQGMGVNTVRVGDGPEGGMGYNIATDANWAQKLESILITITGINRNGAGTSTGINKVYWQSMGDIYNSCFGISDYGGMVGYTDINTAKALIDKLAGNNEYGHNFVSDPRILSWNIGNEQQIKDENGNWVYQYGVNVHDYLIQLMDYMRSKGGHVACNAPYVGNWNGNPSIIAPLFYGHADYYEIHYYGNWELGTPSTQGGYYLGNGQINWAGWSTMVQNKLSSDVAAASPWYDSNHILLGEFGVAFPNLGDFGHPEISVTPQMQADYFTYCFQALNAMGSIKWTSTFEAFMAPSGHNYGVISAGTVYDTYSKGTPYPAYYVIAANYAS